jgi:hypothetical protein
MAVDFSANVSLIYVKETTATVENELI